jgi:TrmH family RNA methyltransferase
MQLVFELLQKSRFHDSRQDTIPVLDSITSRHNSLVRRFHSLARHRPEHAGAGGGSTEGQPILLEGAHLVEEALSAGVTIEVAAVSARLLDQQAEGGRDAEIRRLADRLARGGTRVVSVGTSVMAAMSPADTPSGLVAIARHEPATPDAAFSGDRAAARLTLVAESVQDPGNLGAMIRTAEAAGATGVVASGVSADPFGWKALRGAMGSTLRLPVARVASAREAIEAARRNGLRVVASAARADTPLFGAAFRGPIAILMGGEGAGLPADALELADEVIAIPMQPPVESLNVAVAAGLLLYEAVRQRSKDG